MSVRNLEPKALWNHFADLNAVPRGSKKEEKVIQFMLDFGSKLNLETIQDAIGNVIIKKKASAGMENLKTVILQSHLDMVHQKNNATVFDFDTQGIEMIVEGDWVRANGTTLGADNGIGVATIMAILASDSIAHPAIEAMFTIDEETGMTGAINLDPANFSGEILLNLDTEDDDELSIGCAGGIDTNTSFSYKETAIPESFQPISITVNGLLGGHSGMDIDKGRGNANKLMNRLFFHFLKNNICFSVVSIDGGSLRNAIPRESNAIVAVKKTSLPIFEKAITAISSTIKEEFKSIEKSLNIEFSEVELTNDEKMMAEVDVFVSMIKALQSVHNGVYRMSPDFEGLVETSSSLARILVKDGEFVSQSLQRSSVESTKDDVAATIRSAFENMGCKVVQTGDYPGWQPKLDSQILNLMKGLYEEKYNEKPQVKACHAGLECGILLKHLPNVDTISFGPNIRAAHSPDEKVQISSVLKFWDYLMDTLKLIPVK